jgi:signal transduction histidine kinase
VTTIIYYYLVLFCSAISIAGAVAVFWKNRFQAIGPLFGATMLIMGLWLCGFAQYYIPLSEPRAYLWAKITMAASICVHAVWFHTMCELAQISKRMRWGIAACYATGAVLMVVLWSGVLLTGLKEQPHMDHYVHYHRVWYPILMVYLVGWQWLGIFFVVQAARKEAGYRRTQLGYFIAAWAIIFVTTTSIIIPLQYEVNIPRVGFLILPLNLMFLAYVMAKARLADFNVVAARALIYSVTIAIVVGVAILFVGAVEVATPGFLNQQQTMFVIVLTLTIGLGLTITLPRFLPQVERIMSERLFGGRMGYQEALTGMIRQLSRLNSVDQVLETAATTVHTQMQLVRVLFLVADPMSGRYRLQAQSGVAGQDTAAVPELGDDSSIILWLQANRTALVRDEMARRVSERELQPLIDELDAVESVVCIPMFLDDQLTGLICLGEKLNRQMFYEGDLRILENMASEVALAIRYRRIEDAVFRKNRLVELGTIAAGVAHEIRNPLASIRTFAQLLPDKMDDPEFTNEFSKLVLSDVDRITKVIESMLAFARPAQVTIAEYPAADLVNDSALLVQPRLKNKRVVITKQFFEQPVVRVDKQQILQVIVNLLNNAIDALGEGGKINMTVGVQWLDGIGDNEGRSKYAVIEVSDNGPGIPAAVRNRLFDPFFTTKKEGTGLGLSISQKIMRDHGGYINLISVEGQGTTFQVNLPL